MTYRQLNGKHVVYRHDCPSDWEHMLIDALSEFSLFEDYLVVTYRRIDDSHIKFHIKTEVDLPSRIQNLTRMLESPIVDDGLCILGCGRFAFTDFCVKHSLLQFTQKHRELQRRVHSNKLKIQQSEEIKKIENFLQTPLRATFDVELSNGYTITFDIVRIE